MDRNSYGHPNKTIVGIANICGLLIPVLPASGGVIKTQAWSVLCTGPTRKKCVCACVDIKKKQNR